MAKTRIQKIDDIATQMAQMKHDRDRLIAEQKEADRKARDHRVCQRGGYIESVLPEVIPLTFEQFKAFINKTLVTEFAKRELTKIAAQSVEPSAETPPTAEKPAPKGVAPNATVGVSSVK